VLRYLTGDAGDTIPITPLSPGALEHWLGGAPAHEQNWIEATGFTGKPGKLALVPSATGRVARVLVGVDGTDWLWALAGLPDALPEGRYRLDAALQPAMATQAALGWALGTYVFSRYKPPGRSFATLVWPEGADRGEAERLARGIGLARDLVNTPASDMGPAELAAVAEDVARRSGARCTVTVGDELLEKNYPTIHAVGRASAHSPRLIDIVWGDPTAPKVTLVGKGVCFDSGGLDLKSGGNMRLMKKDMGGAATALGLADVIMDAQLPVRLRVLLPAVENAVSANAFRPLDVIRTRKGITVEVGNTDAEGRLILCDALAEADSEKPALIVDFATLTGAARVALGPELPALFCSDDRLADDLLRAGQNQSDPLWRLPLWQPYRKLLDSKVADINNVSESGFAGAVIAALYLREFVSEGTSWAHLDLFAWNVSPRPGRPEGGEALGLRAVYAMLRERFA
jgi:leucyl aminopeptidase